MVTFFNKQRFGAIASVVTTLLIASGCRSASVNSNSGLNSNPGNGSFPPFYRSFERSPQPIDENSQPPGLEPEPPSILPAPGYSEPEAPPSPAVPPSPSAKRSKWNLIPSGFKFPSMSRQNNQVNQTGSKTYDRPVREKREVVSSVSSIVQDQDEDLKEETVAARSSVKARRSELARPTASRTDVVITPGPSTSGTDEITSDRTNAATSVLLPPDTTRPGVIPRRSSLRGNLYVPEGFKANESVGSPVNEQGSLNSTGEVPLLLPPNP